MPKAKLLFPVKLINQKAAPSDIKIRNLRYRYQGLLSGPFTGVKARRPQLVLGWVTTREDWALRTWVRLSVCN